MCNWLQPALLLQGGYVPAEGGDFVANNLQMLTYVPLEMLLQLD
jgi:hypothetical protein